MKNQYGKLQHTSPYTTLLGQFAHRFSIFTDNVQKHYSETAKWTGAFVADLAGIGLVEGLCALQSFGGLTETVSGITLGLGSVFGLFIFTRLMENAKQEKNAFRQFIIEFNNKRALMKQPGFLTEQGLSNQQFSKSAETKSSESVMTNNVISFTAYSDSLVVQMPKPNTLEDTQPIHLVR